MQPTRLEDSLRTLETKLFIREMNLATLRNSVANEELEIEKLKKRVFTRRNVDLKPRSPIRSRPPIRPMSPLRSESQEKREATRRRSPRKQSRKRQRSPSSSDGAPEKRSRYQRSPRRRSPSRKSSCSPQPHRMKEQSRPKSSPPPHSPVTSSPPSPVTTSPRQSRQRSPPIPRKTRSSVSPSSSKLPTPPASSRSASSSPEPTTTKIVAKDVPKQVTIPTAKQTDTPETAHVEVRVPGHRHIPVDVPPTRPVTSPKRMTLEGKKQPIKCNPEKEKITTKKKSPRLQTQTPKTKTLERVQQQTTRASTTPDLGIQMHISTKEKKELEGSPQQPKTTVKTVKPKCKKTITYVQDYLLTEPKLTDDPTQSITTKLADAHNFALTLLGDPIIEKVEPYAPMKDAYKMTVRLPEKTNMTALLKMWNNTAFNNINFQVQEYIINM